MSLQALAVSPQGDPAYINQAWYLSAIQAPQAWDLLPADTSDVKIAVIDMDFDLSYQDLRDVFDIKLSKDFSGSEFRKFTPDGESSQHGTLVSGLIAADGLNDYGSTGIVRKGSLIAINIAPVGPLKINIADAIRHAVDSGAKVINGSFGYRPSADEIKNLKSAVEYARQKDVVMLFSAGNYHDDLDKIPFYPASLTTEFDNVISVGASSRADGLSVISSFGKKNVDLLAPGEAIIVSHLPGQFKMSVGTSEASPITAGVVALMRKANPKLKAGDIKRLLLKNVDKLPALKGLCVSEGRLNAFKAVKAATVGQ
ncbi:MAG: hypothetical protein K0R29_2956 [Pseudobdellovibrio sp.]|nr:hypothetical protein [Pseudobdellovibrio sp.]